MGINANGPQVYQKSAVLPATGGMREQGLARSFLHHKET